MLILLFIISFGTKYGGEFMELGVGARPLGMGSAFVAISDDATAPYWNPAGLAIINNKELFFMHSESFQGEINHNSISYVHPYTEIEQSIGVSLYQVGIPNMPITDTLGNIERTVNLSDWVFYFSYGKNTKWGPFGLSVKAIMRNMAVNSAYGMGTDAGVLLKYEDISLGISIENLFGTVLVWDTGDKDYIAPVIKVGIAFSKYFPSAYSNVILASGVDLNLEGKMSETPLGDTHLGIEYWYKGIYAFRIGQDWGKFTVGAGMVYKQFKIDYAMKFHPELGRCDRISGSIIF